MSIWKIVSGILSIVLCFFVIFQSCAAGIVNAMSQNGDISGSAGLIVAILLLTGGIVSIATRDAIGNGGNVALIIIFGLATLIGYLMAGIYTDLVIWATWCLLCSVIAAMAIAADNVCSAWVFILISIIGIIVAVVGFGMNMSEEDDVKKISDDKRIPVAADKEDPEGEEVQTFELIPKDDEKNSGFSGNDDSSSGAENVFQEYKNALKQAETYSDMMYMSKQAIYDQLVSEYGGNFPEEAAQYAIDNLNVDYKENALKKAKTYYESMSMSKDAVRDQLVSEYGEKFTEEEADYAMEHLE